MEKEVVKVEETIIEPVNTVSLTFDDKLKLYAEYVSNTKLYEYLSKNWECDAPLCILNANNVYDVDELFYLDNKYIEQLIDIVKARLDEIKLKLDHEEQPALSEEHEV